MNTYKNFIPALALCGALLTSVNVNAQTAPVPVPAPPQNWHTMDLTADGYFGISLNKAYQALKGKKSKTVVVATIDSGIDTAQADLKPVLWVNTKEKAGNGKDDDGNGYIDDVHGWNFLGGPGGKCDFTETTEEVREYNRLKGKYLQATEATATDKKEFNYWQKVKVTYDSTIAQSSRQTQQYGQMMNVLMGTSGYIKRELKLPANGTFKAADLEKIKSTNDTVVQSKGVWGYIFAEEPNSTNSDVLKEISEALAKFNNDLNPDLEARARIVGDDPNVWDSKPYGSHLVKFDDASHGTGVAGLIGAVRDNKYGINGVADNVRIMAIKAVPNGDEYDKDIAKAIRYAVDNGAKIINMSFGKKLSPHKKWVDDAFKYAAEKDVLLVQAAGNDHQDVDAKPTYPNDQFEDGSVTDAANLLCVGASSAKKGENLPGDFSNYGKNNVDVFAPGVKVTSVDKDAEFNTADGTSFASPITAGVAALLLEYYPNLSARQLKQIIMQSAKPLTGVMVKKPGSDERVDFTTLSKTGGVVNAFEAVQIAAKTKGERKN
ncbi:S8 family serine peptidase [Mucilaginibacter aquatilis]|uniref:S8 family serine peptidase n=1 Tax=Mucilaginibacter aquatilis TaxID=1517760 RepID=A0A6I4I6A8_9SPHI|nr:S8 family serine peptidase [Mucilaginibacter aquatilis]MVN90670.1 S8 family serine peptidase [Mucilaginibacter aquatilis]